MPDEIITTGFKEVQQILKSWTGDKLTAAFRRCQRAAMRPVQREAKRLVPVELGTLRKSIKLRAGKRRRGRIMHRVTTEAKDARNSQGVYYGGFVHWGTENHEENDFLKRAADNVQNEVENTMANCLRRELESGR